MHVLDEQEITRAMTAYRIANATYEDRRLMLIKAGMLSELADTFETPTAPSTEGANFPLWAVVLGELGAAVLMLLICALVFTAILYLPIGGGR